ncbi:MAG: LuxR C-terminal-related transcriptional regulator [Anaerolineae bacterium]|nr:LuxR C-terminal-related transcriptional regulator [Anaerolineae bacterium]
MSTLLLSTKLFIPPLRSQSVPRPRLIEKINEGVRYGRRLILISAPAGFGKTSLVSQWIAQTDLNVTWLGLDEGDSDPQRFWHYMAAAFQQIDPHLASGLSSGLQSPQPPPLLSLITSLINDLSQLTRPVMLVLDDYHLLDSALSPDETPTGGNSRQVHDTFNFFIDHLPAAVHLMVCTRSDPPLQLSRRRGRGELCELRAGDLRFDTSETEALLNDTLNLSLSGSDIEALEQRTEGWIAGLQLAGLSLENISDKHTFINTFSGNDRYVADYLLEEVLSRQPLFIQQFLLKTAGLNRLCASLCDYVTGGDNSQNILSALEHSNLFLFPLDNRREWFRYHHLFASLLHQRLLQNEGKQSAFVLQLKAIEWFEQNGFQIEALELALAASEMDRAAHLLAQNAKNLFVTGQLNALLNWGSRLPNALLKQHPDLIMALGWASSAAGQPGRTEKYIGLLEEIFQMKLLDFIALDDISDMEPHLRSGMIETAVLYFRIALDRLEIERMQRLSQLVLPFLVPERDKEPYLFNIPSELRPPLVYILGYMAFMSDNLAQASQMLNDAVNSGLHQKNIHIVAIALNQIGDIQLIQGELHQAQNTFREALRISTENAEMLSTYFSQSYLGLANLAYEWNDLALAQQHLQNALGLAKLWQSPEQLYPVYLAYIRLYMRLNWLQKAEDILQQVKQLPEVFLKMTSVSFNAFSVWLEDARGNQGALPRWAETVSLESQLPLPIMQETEEALVARLLLRAGKVDKAGDIIKKRLAAPSLSAHAGRLLDFRFLQVCLLLKRGQRVEAQQALAVVLEMARPQAYLRLFLDEGPDMQELIKQTLPLLSPELKEYALVVLNGFPSENTPASAPAQNALTEPLSEREIEVLRLMAEGVSNAEISERLFVTINTVKKHITNIFNKLEAENRFQAVEKARRLKLVH